MVYPVASACSTARCIFHRRSANSADVNCSIRENARLRRASIRLARKLEMSKQTESTSAEEGAIPIHVAKSERLTGPGTEPLMKAVSPSRGLRESADRGQIQGAELGPDPAWRPGPPRQKGV